MKKLTSYFKTQKRLFFPILVLIFLGLAILLTVILTKQRQEIRPKAVADNGQLTFANLTPATVSPGQTVSVSVNMTGGNQIVVGADVLVRFDQTRLTLTNVTQNTAANNPYKTYAPVTTTGAFDTQRVISCANSGGTNCPSGMGFVEFGIVSFDWLNNALTAPTATTSNLSPVTTLTFQVKPNATAGLLPLSFLNTGINGTTDSNIVVNPIGGGDPEDILQTPGYPNSTATVTISGTASPLPTPRISPSPSPLPSTSPGVCVPATCFDYSVPPNNTVDIGDITKIANRYACNSGSSCFNARFDLDCNNKIELLDITRIANRYGQTTCAHP